MCYSLVANQYLIQNKFKRIRQKWRRLRVELDCDKKKKNLFKLPRLVSRVFLFSSAFSSASSFYREHYYYQWLGWDYNFVAKLLLLFRISFRCSLPASSRQSRSEEFIYRYIARFFETIEHDAILRFKVYRSKEFKKKKRKTNYLPTMIIIDDSVLLPIQRSKANVYFVFTYPALSRERGLKF